MLTLVTLLALASVQDTLTITGQLKETPATEKDRPVLTCDGATNLPNGSVIAAYLYYAKVKEGKEIAKDFTPVKDGKFLQEYAVFPRRTFPGQYIARFIYDPSLQNAVSATQFPRTTVDFTVQIGGPADVERESKAIRDQLAGEIRALTVMADEIKAKLDELKDKPRSDWEAPFNAWRGKTLDIMKRADPRRVPEYSMLKLDLIADNGFENLTGILLAAARCAATGQREACLEGLTRLRQTAEHWIAEISAPKLTEFEQMARLIEESRQVIKELPEHPSELVQTRRKFLEMTAMLDKSVPADFHEVVLDISARAAALFNAIADKDEGAKKMHAELDAILNRFATTLRGLK